MRESVWKKVPENLDILITHGPPKGILDANGKGDSVGCTRLREVVDEKAPKLHIFGHIHESFGRQVSGVTTFVNAAAQDETGVASRPAQVENLPRPMKAHELRAAANS
jgi:Icc-related predicted phosphoesterase